MRKRESEEWISRRVGEEFSSPLSSMRIDSSIAFFFFFGVIKNFMSLERRERRRLFWKKEAWRYVAFLSSTGTLPVPLPLPRDCPANRKRSEDENCVRHSLPKCVMRSNTRISIFIFDKEINGPLKWIDGLFITWWKITAKFNKIAFRRCSFNFLHIYTRKRILL